MINQAPIVRYMASVCEMFFADFCKKTFSAESTILLCAHPKSDFELFEPAAHHRVMHSQMIWRVQALPPLRGACPELGRTVKSFQLFNRRRSVQIDSEQFYVYPKLDLRFNGASLKKIFCRPAAAAG
jgi:hypothetical protein